MASNNFKGRLMSKYKRGEKPAPVAPAPTAPVPGDFVITRDSYGVETWWKVVDAPGLVNAPDVLAVHTKGAALRKFAGPLVFVKRTELRHTVCWDGGAQ